MDFINNDDIDDIKKLKKEREVFRMMLDMMAKVSNEPCINFKKTELELTDKLHTISCNMETITDEQYNELINIIKQFKNVIDDYITKNKIELKEMF